MKISFVMIVYNAASILPKGMLKACIDHIYDLAHEIVVIEGACERAIPLTPDGHSTDNTVEIVQSYPKVRLIQKDGGWKDQQDMYDMTNGQLQGDYVWWLDSDEFFHENDIPVIVKTLEEKKPYAMYFDAIQFFGDWYHRISDETKHLWSGELPWQRIFKNQPGKSYWHYIRPPEYMYEDGIKCNDHPSVIKNQCKMYHYSFIKKSQIEFKNIFYDHHGVDYQKAWDDWHSDHNSPLILGTKTTEFKFEDHPKIIQNLILEEKRESSLRKNEG